MFSTQNEWSSLKREQCSLLMLPRELINSGQLYVIKSPEHSNLHWSRSSLLLALCCSLVDESKTSILTQKKKKEENQEWERTWVFPLQLPIHRAPLRDALHGSTQPWKQSQLVWEWFFSCTLITWSCYLMHLDHGEEAVRVLLVAVASVQPGQQQVKGVAELVTVASPDLWEIILGSLRHWWIRVRWSGSVLRGHNQGENVRMDDLGMAWLSPVQIVWTRDFLLHLLLHCYVWQNM